MAVALCLAFAAHLVWLLIPLFILQGWQPWRNSRPLAEEINLKPTRAEYVARQREVCAAGGG
jgi:hypothetical protein